MASTQGNETLQKIGEKTEFLSQVMLARKIKEELERDAPQTVLSRYLPAEKRTTLEIAIQEMETAIRDTYSGLDQCVDDVWIQEQLSSVLSGCTLQQKGDYLVALIRCSTETVSEEISYYSRWSELQRAESFTERDVKDLLDIAATHISGCASFVQRHEFNVMEGMFNRLPNQPTELQTDSGKEYALAYAAVLYINNAKRESPQNITAYQFGVVAVQVVESSELFRQFCAGGVEVEELRSSLDKVARVTLTHSSVDWLKIGIAAGFAAMGAIVGGFYFSSLVVALDTTTAGFIAVCIGLLIAFGFGEDHIMEEITQGYAEAAKYISSSLKTFFRKENINRDVWSACNAGKDQNHTAAADRTVNVT